MLTVTPPPDPPRSKARVSARLSTRSPRCRIAGTSSGAARPRHRRASAARRRRRAPGPGAAAPRRRHAARVQHAGEGRPRLPSTPPSALAIGAEHEAPDRDLREVGEDRGDEVAHAELAGLDELAHRVLGAAEAADQRVADALAGLLRLVGVVAHRLGRELPAGLRRLRRFRHLRRGGGAGAAGLRRPHRRSSSPRRWRPPSAVSASSAEPFTASRSACSEASGAVAAPGRGSGGGGEPVGRGRWPRRRRPRSRSRPSPPGSPPRSG